VTADDLVLLHTLADMAKLKEAFSNFANEPKIDFK